MKISIVIRTLNEAKHLRELLEAIGRQRNCPECEVVIVDSGSTDQTLSIAKEYSCVIATIKQDEFSFGRSLNIGCEKATGDMCVFISGHCIPVNEDWLAALCSPIINGLVVYSYGRQVGRDTTKFSESRLFEKFYSDQSVVPQNHDFCNNANSALLKKVWHTNRFNEWVTGLEDIELAGRLLENRQKIGYRADATVFHIHDESWSQCARRYEREALALRFIKPEIHFGIRDAILCVCVSFISDVRLLVSKKYRIAKTLRCLFEIIHFRSAQYLGTYKGSRQHLRVSANYKKRYYYPRKYIQE